MPDINIKRKFGISSEYFSHFIISINIYDTYKKKYKTIDNIIKECKQNLFEYIYNLDFSNKSNLKKEFIMQDLWILEKMLDENNKDMNKEFLLNKLLEIKFDYHGYDLNTIIKDNSDIETIYYLCNHCHNKQ
jgi:isoleucyl-tRNA synthetase